VTDSISDITFGRFLVRVDARQLLLDGEPVKLGAKAFDLLLILLERRERVVSKDQLLDLVWPGLIVEENTLQVHISTLRKLLGPLAIVTIPGRGYRFAGAALAPPAETSPACPEPPAMLEEVPAYGPAGAIPNTVLKPPRLIGREAALQKLRTAWTLGQMFVVLGEGGMGKSRLLAEFASQDAAVMASGARPGDSAVPYSTLARLLTAVNERFHPRLEPAIAADVSRLVPRLVSPGQPIPALVTEADRLRFLASVETFVLACRAAGVHGLLIDDVQFADNASAAVFRTLFDPARGSPGSLHAGFATRSDPMGTGAMEFLEGLKTSWQVATVELAPLESADIGKLIDSLEVDALRSTGWTIALAHHAGGNPAYLLESVKTILAEGPVADVPAHLPVPPTVEAAVERRLKQLAPDTRTLAQLAAVAGTAFSVALAASALGKPPLSLTPNFSELEQMQILKGNAFVHDIVQEATLRSVPGAIQDVLHRTVAQYLESISASPGAIAQHWQACGEWARAGQRWRAAADASTLCSRPVDAGDFLLRAMDCFERAGDGAARFDACYEFALTSPHPEHGKRLANVIEQMHALATQDEQRLKTALVEAGFARGFAHGIRDVGHCEQCARRALELAMKLGNATLEFEARNILAFLLYHLDRGKDAVSTIEPNRQWADSQATPAQKVDFLDRYGIALWSAGRTSEALAFQRESVVEALKCGEFTRAVRCLSNLAENLGHVGRLQEASASFGEAIATRKRLGPVRSISAFTELYLGKVDRELGRYANALDNLGFAIAEMQRSGQGAAVMLAESELALTWLDLGQTERAAQCSSQSCVRPPTPIQARRCDADLRLARATKRPRQALLALAQEIARGAGNEVRIPLELEIAREKGSAQARAAFEQIILSAEGAGMHGHALHARIELARNLFESGQIDRAVDQVHASLDAFQQFDPVDLYRPAIWWTGFQVLDASRDSAGAEACLRAARDWVQGTARDHVPEEYRDSFLTQNPINRQLLAAARKRLVS
jgi:DNA-binding winged helix-turn-helix (wHTH) protein/tetratricopeptide (TPR) repeat protein